MNNVIDMKLIDPMDEVIDIAYHVKKQELGNDINIVRYYQAFYEQYTAIYKSNRDKRGLEYIMDQNFKYDWAIAKVWDVVDSRYKIKEITDKVGYADL